MTYGKTLDLKKIVLKNEWCSVNWGSRERLRERELIPLTAAHTWPLFNVITPPGHRERPILKYLLILTFMKLLIFKMWNIYQMKDDSPSETENDDFVL